MTAGPWVGRLVARLVRISVRRPLLTVAICLALAVAALLYAAQTLTFLTSNVRLLPQHARYVVLLREYLRDFAELNDIVVAVEASSPDEAKRYAGRLAQELGGRELGSSRITYRIDPGYFDRRALLYLPVDELATLRDRLFDYEEFIDGYAARPTLPQLLEGLNQQIANAMVLGFLDLGLGSKGANDLRFLEAVVGQMSSRLDGGGPYVSPWATAFSLGRFDDPDAGYFFSSDKRLLFVFVQQRREEGNFADNRGRVRAIRAAITRLQHEYPGVQAGVTGGPALSNDEMGTAFDDSRVATLLAFGITLGLLLVAFWRVVKPLLVLGVLATSLAWSMGIMTAVVGHLSIFSVMFISVVVGVGIDYGIYFLYRYEEEWSLGATLSDALHVTATRTGPGIVLGALTAAGTFFVLTLTEFQGIREFGFLAGTAVVMAFVAMVTLFPACLVLVDRRRVGREPATAPRFEPDRSAARWLDRVTEYRKTILVGAASLSLLAIPGAIGVGFDYNMLKLQAKGVESVRWEQRILARAGRSGFAALATAPSLEELRRKQDAFAQLPTVSKVESVLMLFPDHQPEKMKLINDMTPLVAPVRVALPSPLDPAQLHGPLETLGRRLGLAADGAEENGKDVTEVRTARVNVDRLLRTLRHAAPESVGPLLGRLQEDLYRDFADKFESFKKNLHPRMVQPGDAPPAIKERYIGASGRFLLRIHPSVDIWQQAGAERFVRDLRTVDPDVTGPPVTSFEAIRFIRHGYFEGTLYALGLVAVVTAFILRSWRGTTLALAPLALGVLWTLGLMTVFGLEFNLANVWALPLIIGTAAEYGLNIYVRYLEGRDTGGPVLGQSTVRAVVLNGLTTIGGFGSLLVARHQGIFGLGLLLTIGGSVSLVTSLAVLPVLIKLFDGAGRSGSSVIGSAVSRDAALSG